MATAAAAVIAKARRDVVSHFMSANAVAPASAVAYAPGRAIQQRMLNRLQRAGVIVETKPGEYYLDLPAYDANRRSNRRRAAALIGGVLAIGAAVAALV